jgi:Flp pilus assembly protein protease CpaA
MPGDMLPSSCPAAILVAAAALAAALVSDVRERRIPNAVTAPAFAMVVALSVAAGGWPLVASSLAGALVSAAPLLLAAVPGWVGMGDVKLMAVAGAAAGLPRAVALLLFVSIAGGVQAVAHLSWALLRGRAGPRSVPYGCAIAAGSVASYFFG